MQSHQEQLLRARGAFFAEDDAAHRIISQWQEHKGLDKSGFSLTQADTFIRLVEDAQFDWIVVASAGRALSLPWFDRLFRAVIENDTELWTADDNTEFGLGLFCSMIANWEFLAPYAPEATESTSLTSVRDTLSRIEARIRANAAETDVSGPVASASGVPESSEVQTEMNGLVVDQEQFTVSYKGQECFLGNTIQFRLFERIARKPGKWFSFNELKDDVWSDDLMGDATVGRTIRLLRAKLKTDGLTGILLENPRNMKQCVRLTLC